MALSLSGAITNGNVGPGYTVVVHNPAVGPIPADDTVDVEVQVTTGFTSGLVAGRSLAAGSHDVAVTLGIGQSAVYSPGIGRHVAQGDACNLDLTWRHADGTLVDHTNLSGFTFESVTYVYKLLLALVAGTSSNSQLAQILAAVQHTYSNS